MTRRRIGWMLALLLTACENQGSVGTGSATGGGSSPDGGGSGGGGSGGAGGAGGGASSDAGTRDGGASDAGSSDGGTPSCATLPNPVYLQIGDTQEPVIKALGKALRNSTVNPMTIVYTTSGSCTNIDAFYNGTNITVNPKYIPSSAESPSWTDTAASPSCIIQTGGHPVDLANSALFVASCNPNPPPAGIALFQGPVQAYTLAVPKASAQVAMTAEEAYFTFGFGNTSQVTPWSDEAFLFIRTATKSTLLTWAAIIGVPAAKWKGVRYDKSSEVLNAVSSSSSPEKTVGLLGAEIYDGARNNVSALAFRGYGQSLAYYPDSTPTSFDKKNLRDGHYLSWSPTVWLAKVDDAGVPNDPRVKYVIGSLLGKTDLSPAPDFKPLDIVISKGLVPDCAMQVTRSFEGGELSPYHPSEPCGCYFESKVGGACQADGGVVDAGTPAGTCIANPTTHLEIINQCTTAVGVAKSPALPLLLSDGGLPALP